MATRFVTSGSVKIVALSGRAIVLKVTTVCDNPKSPYLSYANQEEKTLFWFRADCKLWSCFECAEKHKHTLAARTGVGADKLINSGLLMAHITLTAHRYHRGRERSIANFRANWPKLRKRIQRKEDIFAYAMFAEQHKRDNAMHVHMLATNEQTERWWKQNAVECGLGYQAKVRNLEHGGLAAMYATKYLNKSLDIENWPRSFHRCRFSQNWPPLPESNFVNEVDWRVLMTDAAFNDEAQYWHELGYRITNTRTGETQ